MKKSFILILTLLTTIMLTIGCGADERTAKQIVLASLEKNLEINSATFTGNVEINGTMPLWQLLKNNSISFNGKYVDNPLQMETKMKITTTVQGTNFSFDIPVIIKNNCIYIKVPEMIKPILPGLKNEYFVMDIANTDNSEYKIDAINFLELFIDNINESSFSIEKQNSFFSSGNKVVINVTQEDIIPFIMELIENDLYKIINYLEKYELAEKQRNQLQQIKHELESGKRSIKEIAEELSNKGTVNNINIVNIFDNKDLLQKLTFEIDMTIDSLENGKSNLFLKGEYNIDSINKDVKFELEDLITK